MIYPRKICLLATTISVLIFTFVLQTGSATECGGQLTDQAGDIVSPNYPNNYPTDTECKWLITVDENQIIDFRFKSLDLDRYYDQYCVDWVSIYSGPTEQDERIGVYCGYNDVSIPPTIKMRSKGNTLLVVFRSYSGSRKGFRAYYWAHECPSFKYGVEVCNNTCACNETNAYFCDSYDGTCHCTVDWTRPDCSEMIPHCKEPSECEDPYEVCVNVPGTFECRCRPGMVRNEKGECQDSHECVDNQCSHACVVTSRNPHQETCYYPKGTRFDPDNSTQCLDCPQWYYGDNCAYYTSCYPPGTESYNRANGLCNCYLNFTSSNCYQDVNECAFEISPCNLSRSSCANNWGSYECKCHSGFENFEGVPCDDCGKTLTSPSGMILAGLLSDDRTNAPNIDCSWHLKVQDGNVISLVFQRYNMLPVCCWWCWWLLPGYVEIFDGSDTNTTLIYTSRSSDTSAVLSHLVRTSGSEMYIVRYPSPSQCSNYGFDIRFWSHECPVGMFDSNCSTPCTCELSNSRCDSVTGQCICHPGWTSENCTVDIDECSNATVCPEYSNCHNLIGSYECVCWAGLIMSSSDQCLLDNSTAPCSSRNCSHVCATVTEDGSTSERCYCPLYMELAGDECVDCPDLKFGPTCQESCPCDENNTASCDSKTGKCICKSGWMGQSCTEDINECYYGWFQCPSYSNCINTIGGYRCLCDPIQGYTEAEDGGCKLAECHYVLTNDTGEIMNPLYPDWSPSNVYCTWNITVEDHNVVTIRFETYFSWYWYPISFFDGINEQSPRINFHYYPPYAGMIRSTGNNLFVVFQSYNYRAPPIFGLYSAEECPHHMYGDNCTTPCSCVADNSFCDNIDGTCTCHTGWTGSNCSVDINECSNIYTCPDYSLCYNYDGGYECRCHDGLKMDSNYPRCILSDNATPCTNKTCQFLCAGYTSDNMSSPIEQCYCPMFQELDGDLCVGCKGLMYGRDCDLNCVCQENTTDDCHPFYGYCYCKSNWAGPQCTDDFDECSYGRYTCPSYTYCSNTHGGYDCLCNPVDGYTASSNGSCIKIDCDHVLTNGTGVVSVGADLYSYYTNNAFCTWIITAAKDNIISLRFTTFYTYQAQDYMNIFDGGNSSSPLIGRFSGNVVSSIIRSTGNKMYIEFISDGYYNYGYFYGNYYSHKCPNFTYGVDACDKSCKCVKENTQFCDNIIGECICKKGWTLGDCSSDINECLGNICPLNSDCTNTKGSYRCECHLGYTFNSTTKTCDESSNCVHKKCSHGCYIVKKNVEQCVCPDGLVLDDETEQTCVVPYYSYGSEAGDYKLDDDYVSHGNKKISNPIYFSSGAPFGDEHQPAAYVTSHGAILFGEKSIQLGSSIDLTFLDEQSLKVIAPYMSNIDPSTGRVFYNLYEKYGDKFGDFERSQATPEINNVTSRAEKDIKEFYGLYDFDVNTVLVATWVAVKPYSLKEENKEANTFQAVFISGWKKVYQGGVVFSSDEETAYVIFLYQNGKMNWDYVPGRAVSIGVTGKKFSSLKDLDTPLVALLDKVPGNTGFSGVLSFEVGGVTGPEATCIRRLANYLSLLTNEAYQKEIHQLYQCPCTIERLGLQWELYEKRGANLDIYCYVLSSRAKRRFFYNNKRNQLCCYKWLKPATSIWTELYRTWREASYISASYDGGHVLIRDPWYGSEFQDNLLTHQLCCGNSTRTKFCGRFYKIFPDRGCSNFVPFLLASAFGDPHITSLDGLTYTMNGWGEWKLLEVPDDNFYLQARTGKAETANGTLSNATVFIAFAAKESNESSFQVELSSAKTSMVISVNGIDITNNFYKSAESEILLSTDFITVSREVGNNSTLVIASFSCGVSVKVHAASKSLLVELDVLKDLQNKTRGLLGNFNGNKADEFTLSDGTVLPSNISEREIYQHFAKSWIVTAENSVFVYPQGESTDTYQHLEFEPMYRDEADPAAVAKAVQICGDKNDACIFDYLVTGDKSFAESTKSFKENIDVTVVKLANNPPTIWIQNGSLEVNGHWFVYQGKPSYLQVIMNDEDGDAVTLEIFSNVTDVSVNQSGVIKYVPDIKNPIHLSIRAKDSKESYSPALSIPITVCPNCNYHGSCDTKSIKAEFEGGKFQTLACKCLPAYIGENCESEIDACEVHPCFKGQTCTDLTAAQQGNRTIGYTCGPCPSGFVDSLSTCIDIDECTNTSLCDQKCVNTEGSYTCACNDGYIFDSIERKCKDVNECDGGTSNCEQICLNTEGNYSCSCQSGYLLDENGKTCSLDKKNVELCYACSQVCIVGSDNSVTCGCKLGYEVDPADVNSCRDTDECQSDNKTCSQICTNLVGAYECSCFTGFRLSVDKVTCAACQTPFYGMNCSNTCQCNGRGTCDPVKGCVCNSHWTGSHCEIDVDECTQPGTCNQGFVCVNTVGSFKCACSDGYQLQDGQCQDIDECKDPLITTKCDTTLEVCVNNNGSYSCQCVVGYARFDLSTCSDVDECSSNIDECEQICENKPGLYNCLCYEGFKLDDNRFTCTKDETKDTCTKFNLTCNYGCRLNANNTAQCFCPRGFTLLESNDCQDINECLSAAENLCTNKSACENTNGSYTCSCEVGMKLDNDGRTCAACKGETWGKDCANSCSCGVGSDHCDVKNGCFCKSGYTGTLCDQDVDECATGQQSCGLHEKCVNYVGGASCVCEPKYEKINGTCEASTTCTLQMCSFSCSIVNGTETCSCPSGKKLLKDGINCGDCAEGQWGMFCMNTCNCSSKVKMYCDKVNGSCLCKSGWTGIGCDQDVNECSVGSYSCLPNMHCNNTAGSYDCVCDDGFVAKGGGCKKMISNTMSAKFMWDVSGRNLENKTGDDYLRTKQEVETQMKAELVKSGADVISLTVTNLRVGSLIVDYIVLVTNDTLSSLNSGLQDMIKYGIILDGKTITVTQILNGNNNVAPSTCSVRQTLDPCVNPTLCVEEGGTTVCRSPESTSVSESNNTPLVLGLAIGLSMAGVIICVMIILIVCYLKSHKKRFVNSVSCETLQPSLKSESGFLPQSGSTSYSNLPHYFEDSLGEDKMKNYAPTQTVMTKRAKI